MNQAERVVEKRRELVSVANSVLAGRLNPIEGIRQICALRFAVDDPENEAFLAARGIDSETDTFPLGSRREICSSAYLNRMDGVMRSYLADAHRDIDQACREIVRAFS